MPKAESVARQPQGDPAPRRFRWLTFLSLGVVLMLCGAAAISLPTLSTIATSTALGGALVVAGIATILQTLQVKGWSGFNMQMVLGVAEVAGGVMIFLNPMKGAVAVALLVALVLVAQGLAQLGIAWRIRNHPGWIWLAVASLGSFLIAAILVMRVPFASAETPGAVAGIALVLAGLAYVVLAFGWMRIGLGQRP